MAATQYWLVKTEPGVYSIDDLKRDGKTCWDGVRNYQARNFMRDQMRVGDGVLFYHSNSDPAGVAGVAEVCREGYADSSAWEPKGKYFDPKSDRKNPTWIMVDIKFVKKFPRLLPLQELRTHRGLKDMPLLQKGQRLSVQPVKKAQFDFIKKLASRIPKS